MTAHEVQLQLKQVRSIDTDVRQLAETSIDAVDSAAFRDDVMDHLSRSLDAHTGVTGENYLFPAPGNIEDLLECELLTVELKHGFIADCQLPISDLTNS